MFNLLCDDVGASVMQGWAMEYVPLCVRVVYRQWGLCTRIIHPHKTVSRAWSQYTVDMEILIHASIGRERHT